MIFKLEEKKIKIGSTLPPNDLTKDISKTMYDSTMDVFAQEGPGWTPLSKRTLKQRLAQGFGAGPVLDRKRGRLGLKGGIIEAYDDSKAIVGVRAGIPYARIHQLGGTITRYPYSSTVALRKTKEGKTRFAKKTHKQKREVRFTVSKAFTINIPARPYLVFTAALKKSILNIAKNYFKR